MDSVSINYDDPAHMYSCKIYLTRKLSNNKMYLICNSLSNGNPNIEDAVPFLHIRALAVAGVKRVMVYTIGYSANEKVKTGSLCYVKDHMPVSVDNPLIGMNVEKWGVRFPDISTMYTNPPLMVSKLVGVNVLWTNASKPYAYEAEFGMANFMKLDIILKQGVGETMIMHHMKIPTTVIAIIENCLHDSSPTDLLSLCEKNDKAVSDLINDL